MKLLQDLLNMQRGWAAQEVEATVELVGLSSTPLRTVQRDVDAFGDELQFEILPGSALVGDTFKARRIIAPSLAEHKHPQRYLH